VGKVCALGTSAIAEVAGSDTLNSHFDPWFSTVDPDAYRTVGGGTLQTFHSELCVVLSEQVFEQVLFDKRARKPVSAAAELCGMLLRSIWVLLNAPEERAATTEFLEEVLACDLRILLKHRPWSNREL
ncbi:hypothetical protein, partial [Nocardia neocaledoniensis]|uniref:hypothetical protein n=1 Tax=Nocardia neocaledoniensis TaxID=236511 RepID=UPI0024562459